MRLLVPAVLLVAAALTGCGSDEPAASPDATPLSAPTATASAPSEPPSSDEPEPVVTPDDARVVAVTVAGGEVTGDVGRAEVPLGQAVRLTVTSDVADEVHVHGFDLYLEVSPGQAAQLEFVADRPGIFEVELHDARTVLTRLQIS